MTDTTTLGSDPTPKATDPASTPAPTSEVVAEPQQKPTEAVETPKAGEPAAVGEPEPVKAPGAPEAYEFTPPDGHTFDDGVMDAFKETAKGLNLTNEGAQAILDSVLPKMAEATKDRLDAHRTEWREQAKNDDEFGGSGFETNVKIANQALSRFASEEMKSLLHESGLGDHPEFVRAFYRIGKAISEDTILTGGQPGIQEEDLNDPEVQARRMYAKKE